jgi:hypothetical protein
MISIRSFLLYGLESGLILPAIADTFHKDLVAIAFSLLCAAFPERSV